MSFKPNLKVLVIVNNLISIFILCIIMKNSVTNIDTLSQPLICDDFDSKLQEFKWRMMVQVMGILLP
jgi:hypothetical protein